MSNALVTLTQKLTSRLDMGDGSGQIDNIMELAETFAASSWLDYEDSKQALRAAIEQALTPGEPVAWMDRDGDVYKELPTPNWHPPHTPLYVAPHPQREWVGLNDTDLANCDTDEYETARYWERVLREKNGGGT